MPQPPNPRPRDSRGSAVAAVVGIIACCLAVPSMGAAIAGTSQAPRWAVTIGWIWLVFVLPIAVGYWMYRRGVDATNTLRDKEHEEGELEKLRRALVPGADPAKPVDPKEVNRALAAVAAERTAAADAATKLNTFLTKTTLDPDLVKAASTIKNERDAAADAATKLNGFLTETKLDPDLVKAASDLAAERKSANATLEGQRQAHEAAMQAASVDCQKKIGKALDDYVKAERQRPLEDYLCVLAFVGPERGHGVVCHDFAFPNARVDVCFGLRLTNFGKQAVVLHELHRVTISAAWEGAYTMCDASAYIGDRVMLQEPVLVMPGSSYIVFHDFIVPGVPPNGPFSITPSFWSRFGAVVADGWLIATVCDERGQDTGKRMDLRFNVTAFSPFTLARNDANREAVTKLLTALAGSNLDAQIVDRVIQTAVVSVEAARQPSQGEEP